MTTPVSLIELIDHEIYHGVCDSFSTVESSYRNGLRKARDIIRQHQAAPDVDAVARAFICEYCGLLPKHVTDADIQHFLNFKGDAGRGLKAAIAAMNMGAAQPGNTAGATDSTCSASVHPCVERFEPSAALQPSEISYIEAETALAKHFDDEARREFPNAKMMPSYEHWRQKANPIIKALRPYLRTTEPVSVARTIDQMPPEGIRTKIEEWGAMYAALFNQMRPILEENRRLKQPVSVSLERAFNDYEHGASKWRGERDIVHENPPMHKAEIIAGLKEAFDAAEVKYGD